MNLSTKLLVALMGVATFACNSSKSLHVLLKHSPVFAQNHTGVVVYDLANSKTILQQNANRYFIPASNAKLFTFYASLKTLGDSIPALHYQILGDSLIFWGTGDPSFLNPDLPNSNVYRFLKNRPEKLYFSHDNFTGSFYGHGWAWDDYNDYYATEIAAFPIHGNFVRFKYQTTDSLAVQPRFFANKLYNWSTSSHFSVQRELHANLFSYHANKPIKANFQQDVPFKTGVEITVALLSDTLKKEVFLINKPLEKSAKTIYSLPSDSLYKRMLYVSDNMIAEHLMLLNADILSNQLSVKVGIDSVKNSLLNDLPDKIKWVDGSGLSRYNLFTPRTITALLAKIYALVPQKRLFQLLPATGKPGSSPKANDMEKPYIFAKSGSFSNNYNLSGYVVTKKGKVFIFSIMNNNFLVSSSEIRKEVAHLLHTIHEKY
jgi:D-alanyl-D-alanine carboxypeptidase/D-alanyl-D-alanine-endopeptidase (penicillin-binding protein 4)